MFLSQTASFEEQRVSKTETCIFLKKVTHPEFYGAFLTLRKQPTLAGSTFLLVRNLPTQTQKKFGNTLYSS